jgi:hypothetical protein
MDCHGHDLQLRDENLNYALGQWGLLLAFSEVFGQFLS